jgi:SAM-dependent methyltransferase
MIHHDDGVRLREFWNRRYTDFRLSESGWLGAGERLNQLIYRCKRQAWRRAIVSSGLSRRNAWTVLDAGCGQGHFARLFRDEYPHAAYVGLDISERLVQHLRQDLPEVEFHLADICTWSDSGGRRFDLIQSLEVLHLILDDDTVRRAMANLTSQLADTGVMLVTAALPEATFQPNDYLRFRSRPFWREMLRSLGLRIVRDAQIYYWLPAGGPTQKHLRYAIMRLGPDALYAIDRAAFHLRLPRPASLGIDCSMRLLTICRT